MIPRLILVVFVATTCAYPSATEADTPDVQALIQEGIALHDEQRYAEAIKVYERVLEFDPGSTLAAYEKAFAHQASGDFSACVDTAASGLENANSPQADYRYIADLYAMLGSCHSAAGDSEQALMTFREGLARFPGNYDLLLNAGVTCANTGDLDTARSYFASALQSRPSHPSPYFMLGEVFGRQGREPEAMLAYIGFLQLEIGSERSYQAAASLINSMYAPMANDKPPVVAVNVEDELMSGYSGIEMAYYAARIKRTDDDDIAEPLADNVARALTTYVRIVGGIEFDAEDSDVVSVHLLPKVARLAEADAAEAFSWFVLAVARVPGANEWIEVHTTEVDVLVELLEYESLGALLEARPR